MGVSGWFCWWANGPVAETREIVAVVAGGKINGRKIINKGTGQGGRRRRGRKLGNELVQAKNPKSEKG